ncbi:alpha/beta hydrolase [Agrobacterium cavarae]|uniref:alpha/beta hydrolase n=1 Tax=Agrobacterium cavarae TaxID=2528239 RepID=UPI0028A65D74|nr:alpha/beta hydrolase [Agrobacterium cavarae]
MNDAGFQYELALPSGTADCVVVLLHGSGRDENDLLAFGRAVFPNAVLYALRGAVPWENGYAFFRRKPDRQIDVDDLKAQATRLCMFMDFVIRQTGQTPFLVGYSNGAIMAAEVLCQNGSLAQGAILLRPLSPRKHEELPSLSGVPVLLLAARHDERRAENDARDLADQFTSAGADVRLEMLEGGHGWAEDAADQKLSHQWLAIKEPG